MRASGSGDVKDDARRASPPRGGPFGPSLRSPGPKANAVHGLNGSDRQNPFTFTSPACGGGGPDAERSEERLVEGASRRQGARLHPDRIVTLPAPA